ncbi:MAG: hypothetical protein DMG74_18210 [Acidobacteria bacterium]|nr:MAG: hypothetical protein DMG74_18210 [Acidobacteriota bacterium]
MPCILIVDDSPAIRGGLRSLVEQQTDWKVCGEAENGRDGVDQAKRLHPDLILLDQSMPVMTGLEAARELRRLMPRVPLLMFTMFKNPFFEREAHAAGVSVVKSKSEDVQSLLVSIQELLKSANLITAI